MTGNIDDTDIQFLRILAKHGGTADTPTIRRGTGFSKGTVRYRFGKLNNEGLIIVGRADSPRGGGTPPKTATLSDTGRRVLDEVGEDDDGDERPDRTLDEQVAALEQENARLRARLDLVCFAVDELEEEIDWFDSLGEAMFTAFDAELDAALDAAQ